jgi:hypothetical protein
VKIPQKAIVQANALIELFESISDFGKCYSDKLCAGLPTLALESSELVREVHDMASCLLV